MSVSPHARASAIFTTVATAVCCAPEPPRSAKFNSPWDNPSFGRAVVNEDPSVGQQAALLAKSSPGRANSYAGVIRSALESARVRPS